MPREIDERKKRKALRKLRRAADLAGRGEGPPLSDWEREFLDQVEERIETYGSAFNDPDKGRLEEPMSALQTQKLREIDKKARGKGQGLKTRKPLGSKKKPAYTPRMRQIDDDIRDNMTEPPPRTEAPQLGLVKGGTLDAPDPAKPKPKRGRPKLRVISNDSSGD